MTYTIRREGSTWVVRDPNGRFQAGRRTHQDAIHWAHLLAAYQARRRTRDAILRIALALGRMEQNR